MNLDHLRYFVITAETLHTARAAKIANVSQSTISHAIAKLEEQIGQDLFENVGRRILLTSVGQRLLVRAKALLTQTESILTEVRSGNFPLEGTFRVGATHGLSDFILTKITSHLQRSNPQLVFEIYSLRSAQVMEGVINRTLDFGICFSPTSHPEAVVIQKFLTPLKIAVKNNHKLLKIKSMHLPGLLSNLTCASPKAYAGIDVCENHPALKRAGIHTNVALIFDSYLVAADYLKLTEAWCLMPNFLIKRLSLKSLEIKNFQADANISVVAHKEKVFPEVIAQTMVQVFQSLNLAEL